MIRTITSLNDLVSAFGECKQVDFPGTYTLTFEKGKEKRRSLLNRLYYHWLGELSAQTEYGKEYWRGHCKWDIACPILARDDRWFNENIYEPFMENYSYEQVIAIMGTEAIAVTRLMNNKQMSEYLTDLRNKYESEEFVLTDSSDEMMNALYGAKR